jgi:hypothetical protein
MSLVAGIDSPQRRTWHDLTQDEQDRVVRLLQPDPDDNLDDLLARLNRASEIIRGDA